jgi:leader peptidase (prepilin peptidase)/N-methyltransferase
MGSDAAGGHAELPAAMRAPQLRIGVALGAVAVAVTLIHFGLSANAFAWCLAQLALVAIALHDLATRRIPNRIVYPAAFLALVLRAMFAPSHLDESAAAGGATLLFFLLVALAARGGFGMGDVKLAALLGVLLGSAVLPALVLGTALGAVASLALLATRRVSRGATLAYGPYLCLGGGLAILLASPPPLV